MIVLAVSVVGVAGMLFILATSDPVTVGAFVREVVAVRDVVWEWHLIAPYTSARHRADGSGRPNWAGKAA